jgi:DNA polymerase (family 10)
MNNLKLSSILTTIAEISKFDSSDKETVINLSRAARTIRDYDDDIYQAYKNGMLRQLPGIDDFSFKIIETYFENGYLDIFDKLKEKYSEELLKIVRLSGVGTKRVFDIYEKFNIKSLEDLKDLFALNYDINKLSQSFGIDEIYLNRLKFSLSYYESLKGKYPRWLVLHYAQKIIENLLKINEISNIKITGSLRRRCSQVGDIDILILPEFNKNNINVEQSIELINKIKQSYFIKELSSKDIRSENISAKFLTVFDIDTEIIITSKKMWANDLFTTTGSKNHLKKLKTIAKEKGCFNEELNLFNFTGLNFKEIYNYKNNNNLIEEDDFISPEEKQIYEFLNLQYIFPELREGFDEIDLAKQNKLPVLIKLSDLKGDLHVHSSFSDGIMDLNEVYKKINKYKYEYFSFSDHSKSNQYGNGLDESRLEEKLKFIKKLNSEQKDVVFLNGSEIEVNNDGNLDYDDDIINKFDIALASIHKGFKFDSKTNTIRFKKAMGNKYIDIIAHPTGVVFGSRAPYFIDIECLIDDAVKFGKALEINSYYLRLDLNEENSRKAKEAGAFISINTDSHRSNNLDMIRLGVDIARKAAFEKKDVINTFSLKELKKWKKSR